MGAQHSVSGRRGVGGGGAQGQQVRLRRRAPTMVSVTSDELEEAGVDLAKAVARSQALQEQRQQQQQQEEPDKSAGSATATGVGANADQGGAAGSTSRRSSQHQQQLSYKHGLGGGAVELPPWEVVANLGESDWLAFKSWLEAGWRCRKCGHVRDDHGDHPKALSLLAQCGVQLPRSGGSGSTTPSGSAAGPTYKARAPTGGAWASGAASPAGSVQSAGGASERYVPGVVYASESPDNQVGFLSDSSATSRASSTTVSPRHTPQQHHHPGLPPQQPRSSIRRTGSWKDGPPSPRFREESEGGGGGGQWMPTGGRELGADGNPLGPDACPHLAGLAAARPGAEAGGSLREGQGGAVLQPDGQQQQQGQVMVQQQSSRLSMREKVLRIITRAHQVYFVDKEPNGSLVFDYLLSALLEVTHSPFGFISSALLKADGRPYLKTHAMSNVAWNAELKAWYAANAHKGLVFTNMGSLHGSVVLTGQPVVTNDAANDPRSRGVPPGHPRVERFFGIPLFTGGELIGIYGLANSPVGYDEELQRELEPLTMTVAQLMYAVNERKRRKEAELHLNSVVQVAKEGIISLSYSGHVTSLNRCAREMFGLPPAAAPVGSAAAAAAAAAAEKKAGAGTAEAGASLAPPMLSLQLQDLVPEVDGRTNYLREGLERHAAGGHVHYGCGRRADGSTFPVEVSISKGAYDTVFYVAVVRDRSRDVELNARLQESESRWKFQVQGGMEGVWDWNVPTNRLFISERWFNNLGYAAGELPSTLATWDSLLHPDDRERAFRRLKDHLDGRTPEYLDEHRLKARDGSYRWMVHRGLVVQRLESSGEAEQFVSSHSDVTNVRVLQDAATAACSSARSLLQLEADCVARVALDLHVPAAAAVAACLEMLQPEAAAAGAEVRREGEAGANAGTGVWESAQRVAAACRSQLLCEDVEGEAAVALDYQPVLVEEVVQAAVMAVGKTRAVLDRRLELVLECAADTPLFVVTDVRMMTQVLVDLLGNAALSSPPHGFVRVSTSTKMAFSHYAGVVTGGAVAPQVQAQVLEKHLVVVVESNSTAALLKGASNGSSSGGGGDCGTGEKDLGGQGGGDFLVDNASKLLPLLGGTLSTQTDSSHRTVHTLQVPVNSTHAGYAGAAAAYSGATTMAMMTARLLPMYPPNSPAAQTSLLAARVLVVGPEQVTLTAIGRQLSCWRISHGITCASPHAAFLTLLSANRLPAVAPPPPSQALSTAFPDGTPRNGLARICDVVIVDCSVWGSSGSNRSQREEDGRETARLEGEKLRDVARVLSRDGVGVVVVVVNEAAGAGTAVHKSASGKGTRPVAGAARANVVEAFLATEGELWSGRRRLPVVIEKPVVRPLLLIDALDRAFRSIGTARTSSSTSSGDGSCGGGSSNNISASSSSSSAMALVRSERGQRAGEHSVMEKAQESRIQLLLLQKHSSSSSTGREGGEQAAGLARGAATPAATVGVVVPVSPRGAEEATGSQMVSGGIKGRVLLVKHDVVDRRWAELNLTRQGAYVESAATAEAMMRLLAERPPFDLLILDCHVPDLGDPAMAVRSILQQCKDLAARNVSAPPPLIIATKRNIQPTERDQLIAAGAAACVQRPLTSDVLEEVCRRLLTQAVL